MSKARYPDEVRTCLICKSRRGAFFYRLEEHGWRCNDCNHEAMMIVKRGGKVILNTYSSSWS